MLNENKDNNGVPSFEEAIGSTSAPVPSFEDAMSSEELGFFGRVKNEFRKGSYQRKLSEKVKSLSTGRETIYEFRSQEDADRYLNQFGKNDEDDPRNKRIVIDDSDKPWYHRFNPAGPLKNIEIDDARREELVSEIFQLQEDIQQLPQSEAMSLMQQTLASDKDTSSKISDISVLAISHPNLIPELISSSAGSAPEALALGLIGSIGGPLGVAAGSFIGSLNAEEANGYLTVLDAAGVDILDPEQFRESMLNPEVRDDIKRRALNRGLAVASVDALLSLVTAGLTKGIGNKVLKAGSNFAGQSAGEGVSEISGQAAAGQEIDLAEGFVESLASGPTSLVESIGMMNDPATKKALQQAESIISGEVKSGKENLETNPEQATQQDINEAVETGDAEIDSAVEEVTRELDESTEQQTDSDQQLQPSGDQEEVLGVGEENESGSGVPSRETNQEITAEDALSEYMVEGDTDIDSDVDTVIEEAQPINISPEEMDIKSQLTFEANEAAKDYSEVSSKDRVKDRKYLSDFHESTVKLVDRFSASLEEVLGNMTEKSKAVGDLLGRDILAPIQQSLVNISERDKAISNIIKESKGKKINKEKVGMFAYLNIEDNMNQDQKLTELTRSAYNKDYSKSTIKRFRNRVRGLATEQDKMSKMIEEYKANPDEFLNSEEKAYYDKLVGGINKESNERQLMYDQLFNKKVSNYNNYVPMLIDGFTSRKARKANRKQLQDSITGKQYYNKDGETLSSPASKRTKEKKGVGDGFYNLNIDDMVQRGMSELHQDQEIAPTVFKMKKLLGNKDFVRAVGQDNADYIAQRIQTYINTSKNLNKANRGEIEKTAQKVVTNVKRSYLSDPSQILKQFIPAAAGMITNYAFKPKALIDGMRMAAKADDNFIKDNVPGLYLRKQNLDHLVESSEKDKSAALNKLTYFLGAGDYAASKLLFFTEYANQGGTLENVDQNAVNRASIKQARAQGTNALSTAPPAYANQSLAMQVFLPFSMMPLNISRQVLRNLNPAKLTIADRRAQLTMGMMNIIGFQIVSEAVREAYDEFEDAVSGEDEEREMVDGVLDLIDSEEVHKKIMVKSAMDAAIGWAPAFVQDEANRYVFAPQLDAMLERSRYKDDPAINIYFGEDDPLVYGFGVLGSLGEDVMDASQAMIDAAETGDEDAMKYATLYGLEVGMTISSRMAARFGSASPYAYGPGMRALKIVKNRYKEDFKRSVARSKEREKERNKR